jgi:hypothetical protein
MVDDKPRAKDDAEEEQRWEIDPERSTADEIVLRPARHPSRGHTRTMGDIVEFLHDVDEADSSDEKPDPDVDGDS